MRRRAKDESTERLVGNKKNRRRARLVSVLSLRRGRSDDSTTTTSSTTIVYRRQESARSETSLPDLSSSDEECFLTSRSQDDDALYQDTAVAVRLWQPLKRLSVTVGRRTLHTTIDVVVYVFALLFSLVESIALFVQTSTVLAHLGLLLVYVIGQVLRVAHLFSLRHAPPTTAPVVQRPAAPPPKSPRWHVRKRSNRRLKRQNSGI